MEKIVISEIFVKWNDIDLFQILIVPIFRFFTEYT